MAKKEKMTLEDLAVIVQDEFSNVVTKEDFVGFLVEFHGLEKNVKHLNKTVKQINTRLERVERKVDVLTLSEKTLKDLTERVEEIENRLGISATR